MACRWLTARPCFKTHYHLCKVPSEILHPICSPCSSFCLSQTIPYYHYPPDNLPKHTSVPSSDAFIRRSGGNLWSLHLALLQAKCKKEEWLQRAKVTWKQTLKYNKARFCMIIIPNLQRPQSFASVLLFLYRRPLNLQSFYFGSWNRHNRLPEVQWLCFYVFFFKEGAAWGVDAACLYIVVKILFIW